jgi:hypothetical protein
VKILLVLGGIGLVFVLLLFVIGILVDHAEAEDRVMDDDYQHYDVETAVKQNPPS